MNEQTRLFLAFAERRSAVIQARSKLIGELGGLGQDHERDIVAAQELYGAYRQVIHNEFMAFITSIDVNAVAVELQD